MKLQVIQKAANLIYLSSTVLASQERPLSSVIVGNSISKLQIQVATYVSELSAGNCHR
jgi:hypothetical protein